MLSPTVPVGVFDMPDVLALDHIDEPVQRFLAGVVSSRTHPVVEVNGHRVHFVVRPLVTEPADGPWTDAKNHRRCALIDKEIDGTIAPEVVELEELQGQMRRHVNAVAPLPLAAARKLHAELLAKAALAAQP